MGSASSKSRPRRSMRVATVFTGIAACTAGMTQVAEARDAAHRAAIRPAASTYGSIKDSIACGDKGTHPSWLHVSTTAASTSDGLDHNIITSVCFGDYGTYESPPYYGMRAECGGTNHGFLVGSVVSNEGASVPVSATFGPGTTYRTLFWAHLWTVAINSWTGDDTCGRAPHYGQVLGWAIRTARRNPKGCPRCVRG
jgi:hypothetical protein